MNLERDILDPSWMCLDGTFNEQVEKLFQYVRLSKDQVEKELLCLFKDVESSLASRWPGSEIAPYGSLYQGTGFKTSDVDCFVQIPIQCKTAADTFEISTRDILNRRPDIFGQVSAVTNVPVPVVKFYHLPTRRQCDLTFDCPPGVHNTKLLWYLLHLDERALNLAILVKYWAKVHDFTGPYLLRTYALTLMVIFYLQQLDILPTVRTLQRNVPFMPWQVWNVGFEESKHSSNNQWSVKQLLGGFLSFFSTYNFEENIISAYLGRSITRERFKKISSIPVDFELYRENLRKKMCAPLALDTAMCVQDVFNHSSNCSIGVFPKLGQNIIEYFRLAAKQYKMESDENFLRAILTKPKD